MRLIDGNRLLNLARSERDTCGKDYDFDGLLSDIENAPTVDAAPVKHGRWIENEGFDGDSYYTCSSCHCDWTTIDGTPTENYMRYCPECGAKMDLEEDQ